MGTIAFERCPGEIAQFQVQVLSEEHIGAVQITLDDAILTREFQRLNNLLDPTIEHALRGRYMLLWSPRTHPPAASSGNMPRDVLP